MLSSGLVDYQSLTKKCANLVKYVLSKKKGADFQRLFSMSWAKHYGRKEKESGRGGVT